MKYEIVTKYPDVDLRARWNVFLAEAPLATHYVTPNFFIDPFVRGGERFAVLAVDESDAIRAVLTGIDCSKKIFSGLPTRPQIAFGKNGDRYAGAAAIAAGLREKGGDDLEMTRVYAWEQLEGLTEAGFTQEKECDANSVIMLDLSAGADEVFKGFSQTRRNEVRKAIKQGRIEIKELETESEFAEVYEIHTAWNRRKGNRPDTFDELRTAAGQAENRKVFIAKHEGKVIAASYYRFSSGGVVEYAANNSMPEYQKFRPNDLIGWHAIQWACRASFPLFSMGGSHLFLRRFGGSLWQTYGYTLDATFLKRHEKREQLQGIASTIYRSLPDPARVKLKKILRQPA